MSTYPDLPRVVLSDEAYEALLATAWWPDELPTNPIGHAHGGAACQVCHPHRRGIAPKATRTGQERRRAGMDAVVHGGVLLDREEWLSRFTAWLPAWVATRNGDTFTMDDIVLTLERIGHAAPAPNLYGPAMQSALRRGLVRKTGVYVDSVRASRQGGVVPEYVAGDGR